MLLIPPHFFFSFLSRPRDGELRRRVLETVEEHQPPAAWPSAASLHALSTWPSPFPPSLVQLPPPLPKQPPSQDGCPVPGARLGLHVTADTGGRVAQV